MILKGIFGAGILVISDTAMHRWATKILLVTV